MRTYCFIGGPTPGNRDVFFRRLEAVGVYRRVGPSIHISGDDKALHIARVDSE